MSARSVGLPLLAIAALLGCGDAPSAPVSEPPELEVPARRQAPAFELPRLGGGEVSSEALAGRILVIDFWATWCLPCEATVPELNAFYQAHREEGVEVYGISIDEGGEQLVAKWIAEHEVDYPILMSDVGLAQRFGAPGFPATFVLAPDGTIQDLHVGYLERSDLEASLTAVRSYWKAVGELEAQAAPRVGRSPDG